MTLTGPPAADARRALRRAGARAPEAYAAARRGVDAPAAPVQVESAQPRRRPCHALRGRRHARRWRSTAGASGYRLAWRVLAPVSSTGVYDLLVDARSGATVRRANRVNFAGAEGLPLHPARRRAGRPQPLDAVALVAATQLSGPNAHAFADVHDVVPFRPGSTLYDLTPEAGSDVAPVGGNYQFP